MKSLFVAVLFCVPAEGGVVAVPGSVPLYSVPALVPSALPILPAALSPVIPAASLNLFWDGVPVPVSYVEPAAAVAAQPLAWLPDAPAQAERSAPWLALDDPKAAAALDRAVDLARTTRAGRKALDEAEKILAEQGRDLPVLVEALGRNFGEYDYVEKNMRLHKDLFKPGREADLAGTIVHELTHVVQHSQGIPSNSLEMEVEAHLQDLQMLEELGLEPPPHTFARQAYDALRESPKAFIALIQAAVPGTVFLGDQDFDDIEEQLEQDLEAQSRKKSRAARGLARAIEADMDLLRTPEGQASYKAFSKRVLALLKRRAAEAN
ncbi:MAG: hypothetical protein HY923_01025 [Elusimicrobia bacterium]|nr:hypothetical protein [Elusimicrobiota bacterium]